MTTTVNYRLENEAIFSMKINGKYITEVIKLDTVKDVVKDVVKEVKEIPKINNEKNENNQIENKQNKKTVFTKKKKKVVTYLTALITPLALSTKAHAEQKVPTSIIPIISDNKAQELEVIPPEITRMILEIVQLAIKLGIGFAAICFIASACYIIAGQKHKAIKWQVDIIKGLGQIILGPILIILLVTIVSFLFRNFPALDQFF